MVDRVAAAHAETVRAMHRLAIAIRTAEATYSSLATDLHRFDGRLTAARGRCVPAPAHA